MTAFIPIEEFTGMHILDGYTEGKSIKQLSRETGIFRHRIRRFLVKNSIVIDSERHFKKYSCDSEFFDHLSERSAYWLGFISADGRVHDEGSFVSLNLSAKDREHLEIFLTDLKATHRIKTYSVSDHQYVSVTISSHKLVWSLARFGVVQNKTFTLRWPKLPEPLYRHFIRGYNDGDGGFYCYPPKRRAPIVSFRVTSNTSFLSELQSILQKACDLPVTKLNRTGNPQIATLVYTGLSNVTKLYHYLYDDSTVCLERKRDRVSALM